MRLSFVFNKTKIYLLLLVLLFIASFLRLYKIDTIPPGLYIDEVSVGYNAYTILHTGKDQYGITFPLAFRAFGEYKMPLYIYLTSISMGIFGKNEFAIRIPVIIFGILTIGLFYFFAREVIMFDKKLSQNVQISFAFLSTFLIIISPWHLQFSRSGFEATIALFFYLFGLFLFLLFIRKKHAVYFLFSLIAIATCMYTYNTYRVLTPVTLVSFSLFTFFFTPIKKWSLLLMSIVASLLILPMVLFSFTPAGQVRFMQVTAFNDVNTTLKWFYYPIQYLHNYLAYFSLTFLFSYGDGIGRHTVFRMGPLFKWELLFLLAGGYFLIQEKVKKFQIFVLFLLLTAPLAAALALPTPHILRAFPLLIPITLIVAYGIIKIFLLQTKHIYIKYAALLLIFLLAIFEFCLYIDAYYNHYIVTLAEWGNQYKELISKLSLQDKTGTTIFVNTNTGMHSIYIKFYNENMHYTFVENSWKKQDGSSENIIYVTSADEKQNDYLKTIPHILIDKVTTPDIYHTPLYYIWKI